jgi:hypothetical protein
LGTYNVSNSNTPVECFGDYRVLQVTTNSGNTDLELIVFDSKVLDKISIDNISSNVNYEFNTLIAVDSNLNKEWYFNTSTKKWTLLPTYAYGNYWNISNEGQQYPVGTGKIAFVRDQYNPTSHSIHGRMITRGAAGNEKELLKVGNTPGFEIEQWDLEMSTETVVLAYKETSNSNWKVRVFDLNLNFLYEVDTQKTNNWGSNTYGKINQQIFEYSNGSTIYTIYNFNKLLNVKTIDYPISNLTPQFNIIAPA